MSRQALYLVACCCLAVLFVGFLLGLAGHARAQIASINPAQSQDTVSSSASPTYKLTTEADPWLVECAACSHNIWEGTDRSLRLDSSQNPHIASGTNQLYYASFTGTDWITETVNQDDSRGVSLALDAENLPWISYIRVGTDLISGTQQFSLELAHLGLTGWVSETVDLNLGSESRSTSIELGDSGLARIAYLDGSSPQGSLKYAEDTGSGWITDTVDSSLGTYGSASLALDSQEYAHISYNDSDAGIVKYAYQDSNGWHIVPGPVGGERSSLALDTQDHPHFALRDGGANALIYAYYENSSWYTQTVEGNIAGELIGLDPSLALDSDENPHISYANNLCEGPCADLRYAVYTGSDWSLQTVDAEGDAGRQSSLALDTSDHPHIGYYAGLINWDNDGSLKYATQDSSGWEYAELFPGGILGTDNSLALDSNRLPHISYYDATRRDLLYGVRRGGVWQSEVVDSQGDVGLDNAIALDSQDEPRISYLDFSSGDLIYAYHMPAGWLTETVDAEGTAGWMSTLAVDSQNYSHIAYRTNTDSGYDKLRYAYQAADGWHAADIPNTFNQDCYEPSLALDANDYPHISTGCTDGLRHIYQDEFGWQQETVDNGTYGGVSSIALDETGFAQIVYEAHYAGSGRAMYAYQDPGGWHLVDLEQGDTVSNRALALDAEGYPHLAYHQGSIATYAYQDASGWHYEPVGQNAAEGMSFGLDALGVPHMIFYSYKYWGVHYATQAVDTPPASLVVSGPELGPSGAPLTFTAVVEPVDANLPVEFRWEASGQDLITHTSGITDTAQFSWSLPGNQTITVMASNAFGVVTATYTVQIEQAIIGLSAANNGPTFLGNPTTLTATLTAGSNVNYGWDFGDGSSGSGSIVQHLYAEPGPYTATVTASNLLGEENAATQILVQPRSVFLPFVRRP